MPKPTPPSVIPALCRDPGASGTEGAAPGPRDKPGVTTFFWFSSAFKTGIDKLAEGVGAMRHGVLDRKSTRLNYSHYCATRMPYSASKKKTIKTYLKTK